MWTTQQFGIKRYLYIQKLAFSALFIDITSSERTFRRPLVTTVLCLTAMLMLCSWSHVCMLSVNEDIDKFTISLTPLFQGFTGAGKLFTLIYRHKEVRQLVRRICLLTEKATHEAFSIIAAENAVDRIFSTIYFCSLSSQILIMAVIPFLRTLVNYAQTGQIELILHFELSTPFDQRHYFILVAFWQFCNIYCLAYSHISLDILYSWLVHNISAQFRTLRLQLAHVAQEPLLTKTELGIRRFIKRHQYIIELTADFDRIFSPILFLEFILNGLQLCLLIFRLSQGVPMQDILFFLIYLGGTTFQLMIYSYGGQRIQDESLKVYFYIYELFPWYEYTATARVKKMLQLSIMRAQKCCSLNGIFFTANWVIFVWVFSKAFSFLTLLLTIVDKK